MYSSTTVEPYSIEHNGIYTHSDYQIQLKVYQNIYQVFYRKHYHTDSADGERNIDFNNKV